MSKKTHNADIGNIRSTGFVINMFVRGIREVGKVHLLNIIFLLVEMIAIIPLTIEVFGGMNSNVLTISAIVFGAGMIGNCICAVIRAIQQSKKKQMDSRLKNCQVNTNLRKC